MATQLYTATLASRASPLPPPPPPPSAATTDAADEARVLREANALLEKIGFGARQFARFEDLVASVSSMSVALYEKLFQFRLEHIVRVPKSLSDYEANAQLVVDALSGALLEQRFDVRDVTGESLCAGDTRSIQQVVRMFEQVFSILEEANSRGEQAHFATPPSRSSASGVSFSERKNRASQSVSLKPVKRLIKKKKTRGSASRVQLTKSGLASDSDASIGSEEGARRPRSSRLEKQHRSQAIHAQYNLSGDANLYETSDVSITRSRGGDLSATRGRGGAIKQSEGVQTRSTRAAATTTSRTGGLTPSTAARQVDADHDGRSSNTAVKKRSRRLNQSFETRPQHQQKQQQQVDSAERRKAARSKMPKNVSHAAQDANLLETQKYGRFVPVMRQNAGPASSGSEDDGGDSSDLEFGGPGLGDEEQMYFGGVSSVSNGGSEKSVHFIEEDGEVSRDFASIVDLQNVPPNAVHSPSNVYDDDHSSRVKVSARVNKKSTNQEEEEEEEELKQEEAGDEARHSPRTKKNATKAQPTADPELSMGSRVKKQQDPAATLYPLLPRGNAAASKSQAEFMRYKLYLKDHLQDLRQREYCQRQHLERAYKVGEHTANVEKIRAQRFQQDIRLQRIAIGLEAKNEEEKHLRHTLTHILSLEKAKLRDEHRTTSSILKQIQKDHAERETAMETFYANQIQLVKEQTHREVKERELVEKAHRLASEQMIREMRREREHQIEGLLQEKQHLEEARRFRAAAKLSSALQREDDASARASQTKFDAFYTAAMKARQHNATAANAKAATSKRRVKQATAAYSSVRPGGAAPLSRRVK